MKIIETTFEKLPTKCLVIGFEGENQRATVRIDCASVFAEYPNATPSLIVKPLFADAYPVVVDRNGTCVDWLITSEILSFSGDGEIQLVFYKDQVICKSAVSKIRVSRSLTVTGDMPDPVVQWIENANRKLAEVDAQIVELEGMVDTATDAATRAEQSEGNATTAANAATSAATASTKAAEAQASANTATAKASEAALSATQARNSAMSAANSERGATAKAAEAAQSAQTAAQKAEQITEAAQIATGKAEEASESATAAQASATNAASSATAAQAAQTAAKASETAASTSASQAAQSAQTASTAAQTATQKAAEASQSASNAATSAETASTKAGEAAQSAQAVEQTAEQLAESLEQISQNTADIAEHEQEYNALKAATLIHSTASGAIASFADGAEMPVDSVTCEINPVQDLHGYDHPWPAGGGKNLIDAQNVFCASQIDGQYNIADYITLPVGTYTLSFTVSKAVTGTRNRPLYSAQSAVYCNEDFHTAGRKSWTFTLSEETTLQFKWWGHTLSADCTISDFMLESGSTATDYAPFSNICPISGFDSVKVSRTGKNLLNPKLYSGGTYNPTIGSTWNLAESSAQLTDIGNGQFSVTLGNWAFRVFVFDLADGQSYRFKCVFAGTDVATSYGYLDEDYAVLAKYNETGATVNKSVTFTGTSERKRAYVGFAPRDSQQTLTLTEPQLELGSTATAYEPYQDETYPITFPSEAGTVYGGSLTIAEDGSGVLTVDRAMRDMGALNWSYLSPTSNVPYGAFYANVSGKAKKENDVVCSLYPLSANYFRVDKSVLGNSASNTVYVIDSSYTDTTTFASAMNGVQLVYELATPITYSLTASEITTLLGENHLWHDANGDISVGYKANTKLYIDGKIAELVAQIVNS